MSVDYYYSCDCCGDARYEENIAECEKCGKMICDNCTVGEGDFYEDMITEYGYLKSEYCPFCNGKEVNNDDLLIFALSKLNMSKAELENKYREEKAFGNVE